MRLSWSRLVLALLAFPVLAHAETARCELDKITSGRDLHELLSRRSIEIIRRASAPHWELDAELTRFVAPEASFDLGGGDVGRPLGEGVMGARALSALMRADRYGFDAWSVMDLPTQSCSAQKVMVEFVNTRDSVRSKIAFSYLAGRLVEAKGWEVFYSTGSLDAEEKRPIVTPR